MPPVQAVPNRESSFEIGFIFRYTSGFGATSDLIFTGTPAGVGVGRTPQRFLAPGTIVTSSIEGIGSLVQRCVLEAK